MHKKLFVNINLKDLILFLSFPLILIILQLSNIPNLKLTIPFKFNYFWQIITSSYIHQNTFHLLGNILIYYLFLIFLILIFNDFTKKQKNIWLLFVFFILPILNSFIHIVFSFYKPLINLSCGSSVIITCIIYFVLLYNFIIFVNFLKTIKNCDKFKLFFLFVIWIMIIFFSTYYLFNIVLINYEINLGHIIGIIAGVILAFINYKNNNKKTL